jgi:hypothetical protein
VGTRIARAYVALAGLIAAILVVIGSLSSWATVQGVSFRGTQANAGKSTLAAAVVAALLLLLATRTGRRWLSAVAAIPAGIAAAIASYRLADIANFVQGAPGASASWGIWLTTIASIALFVLCLVSAFLPAEKTAEDASP